jgi:glucose-1-phosphatase
MNVDLSKIEAIIFDLGGVILDIDINGTFDKFKKLGIGSGQEGLKTIKTDSTFMLFETGKISADEFRNRVRMVSEKDFSNQEFDKVWNSLILAFPEPNIRLLEEVKNKYRTFLMSNTNALHLTYYSKMLYDNFGYNSLDELFEKAYFSHTSGMRKPDAEFFKYIINENQLKPETTLFVDDFEENIASAEALGLKTYHITDGKSILDLS